MPHAQGSQLRILDIAANYIIKGVATVASRPYYRCRCCTILTARPAVSALACRFAYLTCVLSSTLNDASAFWGCQLMKIL